MNDRAAQVHPGSSPICSICNLGVVKDISHFLLSCPVLLPNRVQFLRTLSLWLKSCGYPGRILLSTFSSGGEVRLKYLLDLQSFVFPPCPSHVDSGTFTFQCGIALWLVDS